MLSKVSINVATAMSDLQYEPALMPILQQNIFTNHLGYVYVKSVFILICYNLMDNIYCHNLLFLIDILEFPFVYLSGVVHVLSDRFRRY